MAGRSIRLKEYGANLDFEAIPSADYVEARGHAIDDRPCRVRTDENGFILSGHSLTGKTIIGLGDSVLECLFVKEDDRFCAQLQKRIRQETSQSINVLNGGYSGSTTLHVLNAFINKVVPLKPDAVFLMTGIMDLEAMFKVDSFWSKDAYLRSIMDNGDAPGFWDQNFREEMDENSRSTLNRLLIDAARAFAIPLVFVSTPHQTVFQGAYVQGHYPSKDAYSVRVRNRRLANRQIEDLCCQLGAHYIDIQSFADGLDGMFYDDIHLTGLGAGRAAEALVERGFAQALRDQGVI